MKVSFPTKHPLSKGGWDAKGCDLVVAIGCMNMSQSARNMAADTPCVMISLEIEDLARNMTFSMGIIANTKVATRQLIDELKSQASAEQLKAKADAGMAKAPNAGGNLKPKAELLGKSLMDLNEFPWIIDNEINSEAIIMHEAFASPRTCYALGTRPGEKGFQRTGGGSLGFGIGCATGVKVGAPDRQVVNVIGDGAVMFSAAGWWTQARSGIPVLTIISNNHNYETVRGNYFRYGGKMAAANRYIGQMLDRPDNDFVAMAKAQGLDGMKVKTPQDFPAAIKRGSEATAAGTPFVLDVDIERNQTTGGDSTWIQEFNLASLRTVKV
jgi:thiamine pyrophosphate-dependent acetolactate synthase large subunit-like protein